MRVYDYKKDRGTQPPATEEEIKNIVNKNAVVTVLGDEPAGSAPLWLPIGIDTENQQQIDYIIDFNALNGIWKQELHYLRNAGGVEWANRVFWIEIPPDGNVARAKRTVVYEDVTKNYPRVNGKVQWAIDFKKTAVNPDFRN